MPLKNAAVVLIALCVGIVTAGCGTEVVHIGPLDGVDGVDGDVDAAPDGDSADVVLPDGDRDNDPDVSDGIELPDGDDDPVDILDPEEDGDAELPWDVEVAWDEEEQIEYDFLDSSLTEFSAPGCVGEQEKDDEGSEGEMPWEHPRLVFEEPVHVNQLPYSGDVQNNVQVVDCGNGVLLAVWEDTRWPVMYALSNDNGATWTQNRKLLEYDSAYHQQFMGLGVSDNAAVAFVSGGTTMAYLARLPLPVADIHNPQWEVTHNSSILRSWEPTPDAHRGVAVLSKDRFMISWRGGDTNHYALTTDGGENYHEFSVENMYFTALPGDRYLQVRYTDGIDDRIQYQIVNAEGEPQFSEWQERRLGFLSLEALQRHGEHVVLSLWAGESFGSRDLLRCNFNLDSLSFDAPYMVYDSSSAGEDDCDAPRMGSVHLSRDGRLSFYRQCVNHVRLLDRYLFYWQEFAYQSAEHAEIPAPSGVTGASDLFALLPESGGMLAMVIRRTLLGDTFPEERRWWDLPEFRDIEVYGSDAATSPAFRRIGRINDDPGCQKRVREVQLIPLPDGNVGAAWQTEGASGLWVNSLQQARAGDTARWLYNVPSLYSRFDRMESGVEAVWVEGMEKLITWDGRPCMVTMPALNVLQPDPNTRDGKLRGVGLSCYDSWSSFMAGDRPGPLEMLWRDPRDLPTGYDAWHVEFVPPTLYGDGFAFVYGRYANEDSGSTYGILYYDHITKQWPYMQFLPTRGFLTGVGRMNPGSLVAFDSMAVLYSHDAGQSWTAPRQSLHYLFPGASYNGVRLVHRYFGPPVAVAALSGSGQYQGNVVPLTYNCSMQEWTAPDLPMLDHRVVLLKTVEIGYGAIAAVYADLDNVWAVILEPESGYRSEPVMVASAVNDEEFWPLSLLYHDYLLYVAYISTLPSGPERENPELYHNLYIAQARIEY